MTIQRVTLIVLGLLACALVIVVAVVAGTPTVVIYQPKPATLWQFQAVDTMKSSRDLAREKLHDDKFDAIIDAQVKSIFITGATHVAIGTPYDEEFLPYLTRWIAAARRYNLKVWFRGNWSGWEGWFGYSRISREEQIKKTQEFIISHTELFEHGDLFTACPECENGGPGDPRLTKQVEEYRRFLIDEYAVTTRAFQQIGKNIQTNLISMNADVAALVMDQETTRAVGGLVTIDHYAPSSADYLTTLERIIQSSGGKIVIGEFGAPIPALHATFTEQQQAEWLAETLYALSRIPAVVGINYWVGFGGTTSLWRADGTARPAVEVLSAFYQPQSAYGVVSDELGRTVRDSAITVDHRVAYSDEKGTFQIAFIPKSSGPLSISKDGYQSQTLAISGRNNQVNIVLIKQNKSPLMKALIAVKQLQERLKKAAKIL